MKIASIAFLSCLGAVSAFGLTTSPKTSSAVKGFRGVASKPAFSLDCGLVSDGSIDGRIDVTFVFHHWPKQ
jgi:hypothetical protein